MFFRDLVKSMLKSPTFYILAIILFSYTYTSLSTLFLLYLNIISLLSFFIDSFNDKKKFFIFPATHLSNSTAPVHTSMFSNIIANNKNGEVDEDVRSFKKYFPQMIFKWLTWDHSPRQQPPITRRGIS